MLEEGQLAVHATGEFGILVGNLRWRVRRKEKG